MDFADKPTALSIDNLVGHLTKLWNRANAQNEEIDSYINQTFSLWPTGSARPIYHSATAASKVEMAVATQLSYEPSVTRYPVGRGTKGEEQADLIEPWLTAVLNAAALQEALLPWKTAGRYAIAYGHPMIEGPLWSDFPTPEPEGKKGESDKDFELRHAIWAANKANWLPIRIKAPHPSTVLLDPWVKQPPVALRVDTRYAGDLEALTKRKGQRQEGVDVYNAGDNWFQVIQVVEYWSAFWHALKLEGGALLYIEENETGFVPFCHAYGGFGGLPTLQSDHDAVYLARGILQSVLDDLKLADQALVSRAHAMDVASWPQAGTTEDTAATAQVLNREGLLPGRKEAYWYRDTPNLPQWLFASEDLIRRNIEEGTYPASLAGYREAGVSTVGQQAILTEAADKRFRECREQLNHLATIVGQRILQLVDLSGEDLSVAGKAVGPAEIRHNYNVNVKFELIDPVLQQQQDMLNLSKRQSGLMSKQTYWAASRLADATGEAKRLLDEEVDARPEVHEFLVRQAMREKGLSKLVAEIEAQEAAAQEAAQFQGPQGLAGPPGGNGAMSGLVGPTGEPLPSSLGAPMGQSSAAPMKPGGAGQAAAALGGLRKMLTPAVANPPLRR